jgi:hypothetical protein
MPEDGQLDREAILAAVDLPALADVLLGPRNGDPRSPRWQCPRVDHDPNSQMPPRVSVFDSRQGQRWHCPNCGADGSAVDLVMTVRRVGPRDALRYLAEGMGPETGHPRAADADADAEDVAAQPDLPVDSQSLQTWVQRSTECLWQPTGEQTLRWLTTDRHLPEDVLGLHRIGATRITLMDGPAPDGHPPSRSPTDVAVLPMSSGGKIVHAALRLVEPPHDRGPYLTPLATTGQPAPLGLYRPPGRRHAEILVTSGILDALAANAAGYRSVCVMARSAEVPTAHRRPARALEEAAVHLARLNGPLVLALGGTLSAEEATDELAARLWERGRRPALLAETGRDLSDSLAATSDWPRWLGSHVRLAVASGPPDVVLER